MITNALKSPELNSDTKIHLLVAIRKASIDRANEIYYTIKNSNDVFNILLDFI